MIETLFNAYTPLLLWTGLGIISLRFLPQSLPRFLGRSLYWVGVPWQIFALARYTDFSQRVGIVPLITIITLVMGILLAAGAFQGLTRLAGQVGGNSAPPLWLPQTQAQKGSFVLVTMLGNTGFVGLGLLPAIISPENMGWAVFFSITQNVIGTYGIGVLVASYFTHADDAGQPNRWWIQLRDILLVPSLWAFAIGYLTQSVTFPPFLEACLPASLVLVIPVSFVLMGMRLSQLQGLKSLQIALLPSFLKVAVLPGLVGIVTTLLGMSGEPRLAMVLMAGMPSAFASLILAEEYSLDHDISSSSIALTTIGVLLMIPIWLVLLH
jgi:malate permease and related proteins